MLLVVSALALHLTPGFQPRLGSGIRATASAPSSFSDWIDAAPVLCASLAAGEDTAAEGIKQALATSNGRYLLTGGSSSLSPSRAPAYLQPWGAPRPSASYRVPTHHPTSPLPIPNPSQAWVLRHVFGRPGEYCS